MLSRIKIISTGTFTTGLSFFSQGLIQVVCNNTFGEPSPRGRKSPTKLNDTKSPTKLKDKEQKVAPHGLSLIPR